MLSGSLYIHLKPNIHLIDKKAHLAKFYFHKWHWFFSSKVEKQTLKVNHIVLVFSYIGQDFFYVHLFLFHIGKDISYIVLVLSYIGQFLFYIFYVFTNIGQLLFYVGKGLTYIGWFLFNIGQVTNNSELKHFHVVVVLLFCLQLFIQKIIMLRKIIAKKNVVVLLVTFKIKKKRIKKNPTFAVCQIS